VAPRGTNAHRESSYDTRRSRGTSPIEWRVEERLDMAGRRRDQAAADRTQCDSKRRAELRRKGECEVRRVAAALGVSFIVLERGEAASRKSSTVAGECILKSAISKSEGGRGPDEVLSY
jgi:hypothetical protein